MKKIIENSKNGKKNESGKENIWASFDCFQEISYFCGILLYVMYVTDRSTIFTYNANTPYYLCFYDAISILFRESWVMTHLS